MNTHNLEFNKRLNTISVGLPFHDFNFVIYVSHWSRRNKMMVSSEYLKAIRCKRVRHSL